MSSSPSKSQSPKRKETKPEKSLSNSSEKKSNKKDKVNNLEIAQIDRMLYVSQLSGTEDIESLTAKVKQLFQNKCTVVSIEIRRSFTQQYSYAFVVIEEANLISDLIKEFNGYKLDGNRIIVEKKRPNAGNRDFRSPPRGVGRGCYKCGKIGHFARECRFSPEISKKESKHKRTRRQRESSSESSERPKRKQNHHSRTRNKKVNKKRKEVSESSSPDYSSSSSSSSSVSSSSSDSKYRRHKRRESRRKDQKRRESKKDKSRKKSSSSQSQ